MLQLLQLPAVANGPYILFLILFMLVLYRLVNCNLSFQLSGEKDFLDFTIKKLKIAQRLQLTPSPYGFCGFYS
jgi:hypothetical protein